MGRSRAKSLSDKGTGLLLLCDSRSFAPKKRVWNFQALKTPAFIEAREFQTPFFGPDRRTLPMNSKHYEELCRYFVAEQLGLPLSAIQSLRVPSPERQPESWPT